MPDIKHHFRAGRMNKDLDERLVPNGEYRDAQNIEIITSEGSNVGSIQNVLGNTLKDGRNFDNSTGVLTNWGSDSSSIKDLTNPKCIGYVVDPQNNKVYWFISSGSTGTARVFESDSQHPSTGTSATASNVTTTLEANIITVNSITGTVAVGDVVTGSGIVGEAKVESFFEVTGAGNQTITISSPQSISSGAALKFTSKRTIFVVRDSTATPEVGMIVTGEGISGKITIESVTNLMSESSPTGVVSHKITLSNSSLIPDGALLTFKSTISCIAEFDSTTGEVSPVLVDKNNILKYSDEYLITGANVIDGLLSWTDNQTEPKLIKISKFKAGSSTFNYHTQLDNVDFTEKDITVIKQSPLKAPTITMSNTERTQSSFGIIGGTPVFVLQDFYSNGSVLTSGSKIDVTFSPSANFIKDDIIILEHNQSNNTEETKHIITLKIIGLINSELVTQGFPDSKTDSATCVIQTIDLNLPNLGSVTWLATLKEKDPLFKDTFVRFAYRWKYKEGQYSTFSPFSETAFLPSEFLYESDESNNVGMQNSIRTLSIGGFDTQPDDVEFVEILVKESNNNSVFVLNVLREKETSYSVLSESFGALVESNQILRPFDNVPKKAKAQEIIANRLVFANYYQGYNILKQNIPDINVNVEQNPVNTETTATVAISNYASSNIVFLESENTLIEPGMLITGEGIGENTFVKDISGTQLTVSIETQRFRELTRTKSKYSINSWDVYIEEGTVLSFSKKSIPEKSVKSLRTYQLGAVYTDIYGRETPVFSSKKSSLKLDKSFANTRNRITAQLENSAPDWATHYKFFVKETSSEYYNLALDKFYFAQDGNIWLSFPSAERNKVDEETYLILKKQHDNNTFIEEEARYRVLDISNEAPAFISQKLISAGQASCITLASNPPTVGSNFFQFSGPSVSSNPSFANNFKSENKIEITTNPTSTSGLKKSRKYEIVSGGIVNSGNNSNKSSGDVYDVFLKDPIDETDANVFSSTLVSEGSQININIFERVLQPKDEFFGRFFVKINRDTILDDNVIQAFPSVKSRFDVVNSADIDQNLLNDFKTRDDGDDKPKQGFAWGDLTFGNNNSVQLTKLNKTATRSPEANHPKKGSEFFEFYYGGIDIGEYLAAEDDLSVNVNPVITQIIKPGTLIQFSNDFGDKGQIYEVTGSSVKSEFRTTTISVKSWVSGKRRLYKVFIRNHETGDVYDDPFVQSTASTSSFGRISKISIVKKNIQVDDEKISSDNPAIFETEPKTKEGLDIYHEASNSLPIIKAGMTVTGTNVGSGNSNVVESVVDGSNIELLDNTNGVMSSGTTLTFTDEKNIYSFTATTSGDVSTAKSVVLSDNQVHGQENILEWYNVFSFGNGVESNRIRDDFNAPFIDKGPIVSTTLDSDYKEENRTNSFIFSGIFNSTSGVNELNQFLLALPITKEINPRYGTIQKIFARDADLITFCEDKILKVLANKDALFNADGNTNLTATNAVLGQAIPYVGEYGISKNPESFASHAFRIYFADKARGAVLRLSRDGLTEISEKGMTDFFGDNLPLSTTILGSYNDDKGSYNITLNNQTLSFDERVDGWTSFKSFIPENGFSLNNIYYTYKNGDLYSHDNTVRNTFYGTAHASSVKFIFNDFPQSVKSFKTLNYEGSDSRKYTYGRNPTSGDFHSKAQASGDNSNSEFNIEDTIEIKNIQLSSTSSATGAHISVGDTVKLDNGTNLGTIIRIQDAVHLVNSVIAETEKLITLNKSVQGLSVVQDTNLNFQPAYGAGTELKVIKKQGLGNFDLSVYTQLSTSSVIDLLPEGLSTLVETETKGWFADSITTDQQTGSVRFFKEKENFKFNQILGDDTTSSNLDTKEFSVQGLGIPSAVNSSGSTTRTLKVVENNDGNIDNATVTPSTVSYSIADGAQSGTIANAVFTIKPNTGFSVFNSNFSAAGVATADSNNINGSITPSNTLSNLNGTVQDGDQRAKENNVTVSVDILNTITMSSDVTINLDIKGTATPLKYTVTGVFSTDEKNTTTSSLYNFGYSGVGDYYLNAKVNGLSTDSTPVLHPEKSALMQSAASSTTSLVLDNIFNNEIISVGDTITGTGVTVVTAKVNGDTNSSSNVNVDNNSGTIATGMVVTGSGISELVTVTNADNQSAPVLSKNVTLSDNEDLNFGVAITAKDTQFTTTSGDGDQASITVTNAQSISDNVAIAISSNKIFENMAIIGSGVPDNALVKSINGTALAIKDGAGQDLNATIPDDTILRFGKEIISKTFVADTGFEFKSAPTLDVLEEDESDFSEYTSSSDFISTTSTVSVSTINTSSVVLSSSNSLISVGMVVSGAGISSYTKVSDIFGTNLTLSSSFSLDSGTTLSFFPSRVTLKVYYVFSTNNPSEDRLLLTAKAEKTFLNPANEITGLEMSTKSISRRGETRFIRIFGRPGAKFKLRRFTTGVVSGAVTNSTAIRLDDMNRTIASGMSISSQSSTLSESLKVSGLGKTDTKTSSANPSFFVTDVTSNENTTISDGDTLTFQDFWNGDIFTAFNDSNDSLTQTIPSTGVYSIPVEYGSTDFFRTFNFEVTAVDLTSLATNFNGANPTSVSQTAEVTWTIKPFTQSSSTEIVLLGANVLASDQTGGVIPSATLSGTALSKPKELTKTGTVDFSFILKAPSGKYFKQTRSINEDDFSYQPESLVVTGVSGSTVTFGNDIIAQPPIIYRDAFSSLGYVKAEEKGSIITGGSLGSGIPENTTVERSGTTALVLKTLSGSSVTATDKVAVGDVLSFAPPSEWIIEYTDVTGTLSAGTGSESEPDTYTITGTLNVIQFGTKDLISNILLKPFIGLPAESSTITTSALQSAEPTANLVLSGTASSASTNFDGMIVKVKKRVLIGTGNDVTISGTGDVYFNGEGNSPNTTTITATDSSDAFDAQSVTAVRFFTAEGVRITDLDTEFRKSGRLQRAEFDFQLTTNGAVEFGDVLTIEIKVELGRGL